jgi:hypothetical protein
MRVYVRPPLQPYLLLSQPKAKRLVQPCRARCLFGNDYQRVQVVISLSLTSGSKDQRSGNPTTPEVRMRLNGLEPAHSFIMEKSQIRNELPSDKGLIPITVTGCDHLSVARHLLLLEFSICVLFKPWFSAYDLVRNGLLPIGFRLQGPYAHQA